jgi:hypothetical protein
MIIRDMGDINMTNPSSITYYIRHPRHPFLTSSRICKKCGDKYTATRKHQELCDTCERDYLKQKRKYQAKLRINNL